MNACQVLQDETVGELTQRIIRDNLKEKGASKELRKLNASEKIVSATLDPKTTRLANEEQKRKRENEGINYPDHFCVRIC